MNKYMLVALISCGTTVNTAQNIFNTKQLISLVRSHPEMSTIMRPTLEAKLAEEQERYNKIPAPIRWAANHPKITMAIHGYAFIQSLLPRTVHTALSNVHDGQKFFSRQYHTKITKEWFWQDINLLKYRLPLSAARVAWACLTIATTEYILNKTREAQQRVSDIEALITEIKSQTGELPEEILPAQTQNVATIVAAQTAQDNQTSDNSDNSEHNN